MKTIDFSYFIERFNAGEMSEAENEWFRKELEGNKNLRDEVALRKKTDLTLKNHDIIQLRSKLAEIEKRRATEVPVKNSRKHINMKYAAVVAGFVLIGSIALFTNRKLSSDEIIDRYYKSYEPVTEQRSEYSKVSKVNEDYFKNAVEWYNIGEYKKAATIFSKILENAPQDFYTTLLYGVSNLEIKNYPVAKQSFNKVIRNNDNYFIEDAQWYLALCNLKSGERDQAISQFKTIKNSNSIYRKDAGKILRDLK